jgi:FMN-dependent NADH-azoreductase
MTHILHVDASARGGDSHSRLISGELVAAWKEAQPDTTVTYRDLGHQDIPYVSEPFIYAMYTPPAAQTPEQKALLAPSDEMVDELLAANVYVIGMPMYNFGVPGVFKSYIDQIARAGRTFDPATYQGLLKDKKAYIVVAHGGGGYGPGQAREAYNLLVPTVRTVFGFLGVTDVEFINLENLNQSDEVKAPILAAAREQIKKIVS